MSKLSLKKIYKVYEGGVRAVSDFNLEIKDKEFVVFVGPSGCGKSTTLRMIAGLEEITAGELYIDDTLVNDIEPKDRNIAMVFQNYALYPHMSVFQNMAFGLKLRKLPQDQVEERVNNAAEILGIKDLLTRKPKALSGGQRQRVALGRAIVREPNVFLLDEPLSNLDAKLRVQMRTEITKLHKRLETTFIYVTHDQTEAMTMGDRIVVMKDGFIQQVDTPASLYEEPVNIFVATFLGSPQMNIFKAKLEKDDKIFVTINGKKNYFSVNKTKQLLDPSYVDKEVCFGIRPENIEVGSDGIEVYVDQVEHLGSETIIYAKIEGIEERVTAKIPTNHNIKNGDVIHFAFDMEKAHLFDKESTFSILGAPKLNVIPCVLTDNKLVEVKSTKMELPQAMVERLFDFSSSQAKAMTFDTNKITTIKTPEALELEVDIDFISKGSDTDCVYAKSDIKDGYVVFKVSHDSIKDEKKIKIYVPYEAIGFINVEGDRVISREIVSSNEIKCNVVASEGKTTISFGGNKLVYEGLDVPSGEHTLKLISNKCELVYNPKYAKKNKIEVKPVSNKIKVSAYDEDELGSKNTIFVRAKGFEDYLTLVIPNEVSVYKMPEFEIAIPKDGFIIK